MYVYIAVELSVLHALLTMYIDFLIPQCFIILHQYKCVT